MNCGDQERAPVRLYKLPRVEIVTNGPERSVGFYTGVLGFKLKFRDRVPLKDPGGITSPREVVVRLTDYQVAGLIQQWLEKQGLYR